MVKILEEADIPAVVEIWNSNAEFLTSDGKTHTIESLTGWYQGKHYVNHELYSFFEGDEVIGFCITKEDEDLSWVKMFAIKDEHQNKGYGSKCLKEVEKDLKHQKVNCEVKDINSSALEFFKRNGYKEIDFDNEYNEYILQLNI